MLPKKAEAPVQVVWHVLLVVLAAPAWSGDLPLDELAVDQQGCQGEVALLDGAFTFTEGALESGCAEVSTRVAVPPGASTVEVSFLAERAVSGTPVGARHMVQELEVDGQPFQLFPPGDASRFATISQRIDAEGDTVLVWRLADEGLGERLHARVSGIRVHVEDVPIESSPAEAGRYLDGGRLVHVESMEAHVPPAASTLRFATDGTVESLRAPDGSVVPLSRLTFVQGIVTVPAAVLADHGPGTYVLQTSSTGNVAVPIVGFHPALLALLAAPAVLGTVSVRGAMGQWRHAPSDRRHEVHRLVAQNTVVAAGYLVVVAMAWWGRDAIAEAPFGRTSLLVMGQVLVVALGFLALWQLGTRMLARRLQADLVRREQEERHLRQLNQRLQRSNEDLARFAHVASHDLKEPLRSIQVHSERVLAKYAQHLDATGSRSLELAAGGARRMRDLIDGLLGYAYVEHGPGTPEPIEMRAAVEEVLVGLEDLIQQRGAEVRLEDMPTVSGHRHLVQQAVQNLVANAIKHGGRHIVVRGAGTRIEVADDGPGIPAEHQQQIFEPFRRLQGRTEEAGSGLGLAIVRRTMALHGGRAGVLSFPGSTVFYLEFPGGA